MKMDGLSGFMIRLPSSLPKLHSLALVTRGCPFCGDSNKMGPVGRTPPGACAIVFGSVPLYAPTTGVHRAKEFS